VVGVVFKALKLDENFSIVLMEKVRISKARLQALQTFKNQQRKEIHQRWHLPR
jgi:hypothetical protein